MKRGSFGAVRTGDGGGLLLGLSLPLARLKRLRRQLPTQIADLKSNQRRHQENPGRKQIRRQDEQSKDFRALVWHSQRQPKSGEQGRLDLVFVVLVHGAIYDPGI